MKIKKIVLCFIVSLFTTFVLVACNENVSVTGITISSKDNIREINVDETLQLTATIFPENATNKNVVWSTSEKDIASVSDTGLVTGLAVGKVSIIASSVSNSGITQSFALVVNPKPVEIVQPTSIEITTKEKEVKVGENLALTAVVSPSGASQNVVWTSSDDTIAKVNGTNLLGIKEGKVTITVACKDVPTIKSTFEVTVVEASVSTNFEEMSFTTHSDFMSAENGTLIKVKGIVTYVCPLDETNVSYYIQNGTEGFYIYNQNADLYPVELGKCYAVGGAKKYYQGNNEIVEVEYFKEITETIAYTVNDLAGKNVSSLEAMNPYHNSYVKGQATIAKAPSVSGSKAYSISVKVEENTIDLRVDPKNMTPEEFTAIGNIFKTAVVNTSLEFQGIMTAFGYGKANPQIQLLKSTDLKIKEASPEEQINSIRDSLTVKSSLNVGVSKIDLITGVANFEKVSISWASDNATVIDVATKTVTHLSVDTMVTLTATIKHSDAQDLSETKVFKVNVLGTEFNHELVASFDCEDALDAVQYGTSASKSSYSNKDGNDVVELGTPKMGWLLKNALIANDPKTEGRFGIRMQNNADASMAGRIEVQQAGEYNFVQFDAAIYGNDSSITLGIEYLLDGAQDWVDAGVALVIDATTDVYRIALPEGSKRVAIYIIGTDGKRVSIDNIKLYK